jgi:predicted DNA-binding transcriptional regulator AlpA
MSQQKKSHLSKVIEFQTSSSASPTQDTLEPFITVKQLAQRLQLKTSTIWEWTRRRNTNPIPHFSVSRKTVYFRWSEVVRWIESQRQAA